MAIAGVFFLASLLLPGFALRGLQPAAVGNFSESRGMNALSDCLPLIRQKSFVLLFASFLSLALGAYPVHHAGCGLCGGPGIRSGYGRNGPCDAKRDRGAHFSAGRVGNDAPREL